MNCPRCGKNITDESKYCNHCGTIIEQTPRPEAEPQFAPQADKLQSCERKHPEAPIKKQTAAKSAPIKKKKSFAWLQMAIFIVLACGILGFTILRDGEEIKEPQSRDQQQQSSLQSESPQSKDKPQEDVLGVASYANEASESHVVVTDVPFYTNGVPVATASILNSKTLINQYFSSEEYYLREEAEAIDHYMSVERVIAIYDDGKDVLLSSNSGFYFGTVVDNQTTKVYAFLDTDWGIENSEYGYVDLSSYKTENGYWIVGNWEYSSNLIYIDVVNGRLYRMDIRNYELSSFSTNDRYILLHDQKEMLVIDRDTVEGQVLEFDSIASVPYFDADGVVILTRNSIYTNSQINCEHYYYTWKNACIQEISYKDYPYVHYADKDSIIVEDEFTFMKITDDQVVFEVAKKDVFLNSALYSVQHGTLWQYGNASSYYYTLLVPEEKTLMEYAFGAPDERIDEAYTVGWSGRFNDCYNYNYITHSVDHTCVYDQINHKVYQLNMYHRNHRIYNQHHILWDNCLIRELGGDYGVYTFADESYYQRSITYSAEPIVSEEVQQEKVDSHYYELLTDRALIIDDAAHKLTDTSISTLVETQKAISDASGYSIIFVLTDDTSGKTAEDYAVEYYISTLEKGKQNNIPEDGFIFAVDSTERDYYLATFGKAIALFENELDEIFNIITPYMSNDAYETALMELLNNVPY